MGIEEKLDRIVAAVEKLAQLLGDFLKPKPWTPTEPPFPCGPVYPPVVSPPPIQYIPPVNPGTIPWPSSTSDGRYVNIYGEAVLTFHVPGGDGSQCLLGVGQIAPGAYEALSVHLDGAPIGVPQMGGGDSAPFYVPDGSHALRVSVTPATAGVSLILKRK